LLVLSLILRKSATPATRVALVHFLENAESVGK
jgi:hypothetical protein